MKRFFDYYGWVKYITPSEYYAGDYSYVETFFDVKAENYDIVYSNDTMEYFYTQI